MTAAARRRVSALNQAAVPQHPSSPEAAVHWSGSRHALAAAYLGWTLDAFDFFVMVFVLR